MTPADPEVPFAFWLDPDSSVKVSYSLPVFHEIDFQVNEGYRRIPHGGVEVGGLLYGKLSADTLSIEAFRTIECEHASGPSFQLSERDLANLSASILAAPHDEQLQGMVPLGWFISHTRSALRMTDRELQLYQQFFPEQHRVTVLVKPERFKPTRFAFLLRQASGRVNPDGEQTAVILPLPGRPGKPSATTPAISAPFAAVEFQPATAPGKLGEPVDSRLQEDRETDLQPSPVQSKHVPFPVPDPSPVPPSESVSAVPSAVAPATTRVRTARPESTGTSQRSTKRRGPGRLLFILAMAALLGCIAGYWAYLQLPPPIISIRVQKRPNDILVIWDPTQTQSSRYAVIRVNDSPPVLLTAEQKASGTAQVPIAGDSVKVEIVAPHWARESRGIIRFVPARPVSPKAVAETDPLAPPQLQQAEPAR